MMVTTRFLCNTIAFGLLAVALDVSALSVAFLFGVVVAFGPRSMIVGMHAPRVESRDAW